MKRIINKGVRMMNTLIFDLDGTLVDSLEDLAHTTNLVLEEYGFKTHELEKYRHFVGNGATKLIERALPDDHKDLVNEARARFDKLYALHCLDHTVPYPGMKKVIDDLKEAGYHLAVVTNKPKAHAVKIVKHLFPDTFEYVFGNTPYQPKKPDPTLVVLAMNLMDVSKHGVFYVGDSDVDIQTAINAKVKSIGCSWGFRGKAELLKAGANFVVDHPHEIKEIIDDRRK